MEENQKRIESWENYVDTGAWLRAKRRQQLGLINPHTMRREKEGEALKPLLVAGAIILTFFFMMISGRAAAVFQTQVNDDLQVDLQWDPNVEADLAGYNIYRSAQSGSGFTRLNTALIPCLANDAACTVYQDTFPNVRPVPVGTYDGTQVNLSWPDVGAQQYRISRDGVQVGTTSSLNFQDPRPNDGTSYEYTVAAFYGQFFYVATAVNQGDLESGFSNEVSINRLAASDPITVAADLRPAPPQNLRIRVAGNNAFLEWNAVPGANQYAIHVDGMLVARTRNLFWKLKLDRQPHAAYIRARVNGVWGDPTSPVDIPARSRPASKKS